jgi:hypothetical protein
LTGWAARTQPSLPMREKSVEEAAATEERVFLIMVKDIIVVKERLREGEREPVWPCAAGSFLAFDV